MVEIRCFNYGKARSTLLPIPVLLCVSSILARTQAVRDLQMTRNKTNKQRVKLHLAKRYSVDRTKL